MATGGQLDFQESADLSPDFRGAIVAMTEDRVIGVDGEMPWHYRADMIRFRRLTTGTTIIMGRLTFEAIGSTPLPNRRNIVISSTRQPAGVETYPSIEAALAKTEGPVWFIGGSMIYAAAIDYCQLIDVVYVPDKIDAPHAVRFPTLDPSIWQRSDIVPFDDDPRLRRCQFIRVNSQRVQSAPRVVEPRGENMKIKVNGHEVNVAISGKEDGPIVMMAHSLGCNLHMWDPQMPLLEPAYKCIRLDMRGHGDSDAPAGPYTLDELADDVIAVMDHLGVTRAHWVGLSIGGMIGQSLLLRHGGRFISAALCDSMSALPEGSLDIWQQRVATVERDGLASISDATMERWFTGPFIEANSAGFQSVKAQFARATDVGYLACCRAIMGLNYTDRLSEITTPVSVIVGREDMATPVAASEVIHERIPNSDLTIIDNASHISNVEQAEQFNLALGAFLATHAS